MALEVGVRIGGYEIVGPIGTGGMSEVYRARDLTLGREVAMKVLPKSVGEDRERLSRFQREAQLLAALNHPNIAVIHGLERVDGTSFLVLELVSGRTLAERLRSGPLELERARPLFLQIARALEAAHEKDIIHRDLKPANVMIAEDGTVKLLDFGLGKEVAPPRRDRTATYEPGTSPGSVMGTPAYMSPEQARGLELSKTTDVWSFGVCLFEALTGRNPFDRGTLPDTHSAILNDDPPWSLLPRELPESIETLLRRCLRKERRDRLHDIGDARIEIEEASYSPRARRAPRWAVPVGVAALLALVALFIGALGWFTRSGAPPPDAGAARYSIELPPAAPLSLDHGGALAVSSDGSRLVYTASAGSRSELFLRPLAELRPVGVAGTNGGFSPFFSPAGDRLAFFADGKLRTIALSGGTPTTVADAPRPRGGAWVERDGELVLLFSASSSGPLVGVSPDRRAPADVTALGASERDHRWPSPLPGGDAALFTIWTGDGFDVAAVGLEDGATERLVENATYPRFAATGSGERGHLVFARGADLHAAPFDARERRLLDAPVLVVPDVAHDPRTGASFYEVSPAGTLFYVPADEGFAASGAGAQLLLVDESGRARRLGESRPSIQVPRLSPDGGTLAMTVLDGRLTDVWTLDLERGGATRITFEGNNGAPAWSPDGARVFFSSDREGPHSIFSTASDGSGSANRLTTADHPQFPTSASPDGRQLLYTELHPETSFDLWLLSLPEGERRPFLRTGFEEAAGVFSPDGRFVAYASNESGVEQVYVRRFPGPEGRWQISTSGGNEPVWSPDGSELFFRSGEHLMGARVSVAGEGELEVDSPRRIFEAPFDTAGVLYANYDVTPKDRGFVMIASGEERTAPRIHVVVDWFSELVRRAPEGR